MRGSSVRSTGLPRIDPEVAMVGNLYSRAGGGGFADRRSRSPSLRGRPGGTVGRPAETVVIRNRRARYDYLVLDSFECGIVLAGSEVKSIRAGRANLPDAYPRGEGRAPWLRALHIPP